MVGFKSNRRFGSLLMAVWTIFAFLSPVSSADDLTPTENAEYHRVQRSRDSFVYQLKKQYDEFEKSCGRKIWLTMNWKSFSQFIVKTDDQYSLSPCWHAIEFIGSFCREHRSEADQILNQIDEVTCEYANTGQDQLKLDHRILQYQADLKRSGLQVWFDATFAQLLHLSSVSPARTAKVEPMSAHEPSTSVSSTSKSPQERAAAVKALVEWFKTENKKVLDSDKPSQEKSEALKKLQEEYKTRLQSLIQQKAAQ